MTDEHEQLTAEGTSPVEEDPVAMATGNHEVGGDTDLPPGDRLLGLTMASLLEARALRGIAMIIVAFVILLWPDRTDRVLAIAAGIGLAIYALATAWELVRGLVPHDFNRILSVGLCAGGAVALVTAPSQSLSSTAQLAGVLLLVVASREPLTMLQRRRFSAWSTVKMVSVGLGGALLFAYPDTLLAAVTSITAGLLAAGGLVAVFTDPRRSGSTDNTTNPESGPGTGESDAGSSGVGTDHPGSTDGPGHGERHRPTGKVAAEEIDAARRMTRMRDAVIAWMADRPEGAEDRRTLQEKVFFEGPNARVRYARFVTLMAFASVIASIGVMVESTAVVIGAMLIAPLMVPLMGVAFSLPMGWPRRLRRGALIGLSGVVIAIATGAVIGAVAPRTVDISTNMEVLARITPTSVDLAIAVAAGAAGAYALGRRDVSDSLPGVAVAIALVPPLAVVGICWEQGAWQQGNGALLLFLTNAVAILIAGGVTFVLLGTAPIEAVSSGQARTATAVAGVVGLAAVVVLLLLLNGTALAEAELARADVDNVLVEWTERHEDFRVIERRLLADGTLVFDLAGPGRPPELGRLISGLEDAVDGDTGIRVTWIVQQQVEAPG